MDLAHFKVFAEAFAIGLLFGGERYKARTPGEQQSAGLRTFTVIALMGCVCCLLDETVFTLAVFAGIVMLLGVGYYRKSAMHLGLTTETSAVLTFWLGYMVQDYERLAISVAIVTVILLASKRALHDFVTRQVSEVEFYDTLKFLAVVFVIFPLLPDRFIGPYEFFNPTQVWLLIILVSTISYVGYIFVRLFGGKRGLMVSALLGGLVSTTAVTVSLAERARLSPQTSRLCGVTGVMANAVQFPRLLFLVWVVDPALGAFMAVPLLGMCAVGLLGAWILAKVRHVMEEEPPPDLALQNPYSLLFALKFGLFFVAVFFLSKVATVWFGQEGIFPASAIAGLGDASAISLSAAKLVQGGSLSVPAAAWAILIAVTTNAVAKWALALLNGNRELVFWLGGGFVTMLGTGFILLGVVGGF